MLSWFQRYEHRYIGLNGGGGDAALFLVCVFEGFVVIWHTSPLLMDIKSPKFIIINAFFFINLFFI